MNVFLITVFWLLADNLAKAQRDQMRQSIVSEYHEAERERLVQQSRGWVSREEFDSRIQQALDNPTPFNFMPRRADKSAERNNEDLNH